MAASLILLGALGMAVQAAYLREVLATFASGELIIGLVLASWLVWTALGSGLIGRIGGNTGQARLFHLLLPVYGFAGYAGILAISQTPSLPGLIRGELVPIDLQAVAAVLAHAPCTVIGGFLFAAGARATMTRHHRSAGNAYLFEAIGAACAGIGVSFAASYAVSNHRIALACLLFAVTGALIRHIRAADRTGLVISTTVLIIAAVMSASVWQSPHHRGTEQLLTERDTRYHRLTVTRTEEQVTFYANTAMLFSVPDPEQAEHTVHLPLLAQGDPRSVLIIGGGPGGLAGEVLRYPAVERVVCVELDPAVFALAETYLGGDWHDDPRVERIADDGRAYLNRTDERFDAIILTLPPPLSGAANRYYTREFYKCAASHLNEPGVLGCSVMGAENYISEALAGYLASVRATLETAFPSVIMLPGEQIRVLAGTESGMLSGLGWEQLEDARRSLGIEPVYVRDYYLRYLFSPGRMTALINALDMVPEPVINTDTMPTALIERTRVQGELHNSSLVRYIGQPGAQQWLPAGIIGALLLSVLFAVVPGKRVMRRTIGVTVVSVGLTEISLELVAILAYQSVFGLLYARIALLTGAYMTGLALGAFGGERAVRRNKGSIRMLGAIQGAIAGIPVCWILLLAMRNMVGMQPFIEPAFFLLAAASGVAGGMQFPLADHRYRISRPEKPTGAGTVYALDLAGSALGALITVSLLVPALGMTTALSVLAALNAVLGSVLLIRSVSID